MTALEFSTLVKQPRLRADGKWWDALCPAHQDHRASLSFSDGDTALVVKCQTGCSMEAIAAAVGRPVADFFHARGIGGGRRGKRPEIVATYDYADERGALLYQVVRHAPKDFRCRRRAGDAWTWNLEGVRVVPYRLHELAEAPRGYVAEGERDVDTLVAAGLTATTNHGGAGKWRAEHTAALVAAAVPEVVVLRDNDTPGEAHAEGVARACLAAGLRVKRVNLPGLPPLHAKHGEDVSDWLADGHTIAELEALAASAPLYTPSATEERAAAGGVQQAKVLRGGQITSTKVAEPDWIVERVFSAGHQHMLAASSQGGKTFTLFDLGMAIAEPRVPDFLGQRILRHGPAVIESWEQGQQEDLRKMQKLVTGHGLNEAPDDLILISDASASLNDTAYFEARLQNLKAWGAIAYLVDSLSEAAGIELNDNTLYSEWWRARIKPILDLGCMVVFTHLRGHRKPGVAADRDSASRGATQIRALSTGVLEMRQITDTTFGVRHNKHRNGTALDFGVLELEGTFEEPFVRLALAATTAGSVDGKEVLARQLLTTLGTKNPGRWLTRKDIEGALNAPDTPKKGRVSKRVYEPVLAEMVGEGKFECSTKGNAGVWRWIGEDPAVEDED